MEWLPRVQSIMSQQVGCVAVIHDASHDTDDCVNIVVNFENEDTLNSWADHPDHDSLVSALDSHGIRDYRKVTFVANE